MEFLSQLNIIIHVIAGTGMLIFAPFAFLINTKNITRHRLAGKLFNYCMAIVAVTAVVGVLKYPQYIFRWFLFAITIFTVYNVVKGVRAVQIMKGDSVKKIDFINLILMGAAGMFMVSAALWALFFSNSSISVPILFGVFGIVSVAEVPKMWHKYKNPTDDKSEWFRLHIGSMMGAFIASCTAFTVNTMPAWMPPLAGWFGPTIILFPLASYYVKKFAPRKKTPKTNEHLSTTESYS